ncbi:MAG: hypothetical protein ABL865_00140 [Candidatus Nitrotoga sp.]
MKTSTVKNMHEKDDVTLEDGISSKKRSVMWFFGAFVIVVVFFILAFYLMNIIQFPFSVGIGGPTGATAAGGGGGVH